MDTRSNPSQCPQCGAKIDAGAPGGLCPRCLMGEAMQPTALDAANAAQYRLRISARTARHNPAARIGGLFIRFAARVR